MTSKAEVDKHVETLVAKLPLKEFKSRAYSIAMLYWRASDHASARRYVEQYLSQREGDAAAHKLLAQSLHRLGEKEKALEQYKTALEIDPKQTSLILDICELLSDDEVHIDPGRARYWCERAEAAYPRHPATFGLRERLLAQADADPAALLALLTSELKTRPKDAILHARLLRLHLASSNYSEAFEHGFDVEFGEYDTFRSNLAWYDVLTEVLTRFEQGCRTDDWRFRLLALTVAERTVSLALTESPSGAGRSLGEAGAALQRYDRELHRASTPAAALPGAADFYTVLLYHHRAQFGLHAACYLLKKAKKEQLSWREATRSAAPLLLHAWHATPPALNMSWLAQVPERQRAATRRWHLEGSYRCSQAGHCLLARVQERGHSFIDRVSQFCLGLQWKDKLYEKLFTNRDQPSQIKESHLLSENFTNPIMRLPRRSEVQAYDVDAQRMHPNSLHHMVWMLINYKNYAQFKCVLFDMLQPASQNYPNCGPETLNKRDAEAFLYAAALTSTAHESNPRHITYQAVDRPQVVPACITDSLCSLTQMKWWDCACKVSQNEIGMELNDIRITLRRGIEAVRCIDNHGMDPQLLCRLAAIFSERSNVSDNVDEKSELVARAALYYVSAVPLLERLKSKMTIRLPDKRIFEYASKDLNSKEIAVLLEESKLYLGEYYMNDNEQEKAVDILSGLKSPYSSLLLSKIYNKMAFEEIGSSKEHLTSEDRSKHVILLSKAKDWAYTTSERLKCHHDDKLKLETQLLIEKIESAMSRIDPDMSNPHDYEANSSDDNDSSGDSRGEPMHLLPHTRSLFRNNSSTPKHRSSSNTTHYRSALDTHTLDASRSDHKHFERIESQIKNLNKENRQLGDEVRDLKNNLADKIISSINTNIQDTVDQFKLLKLSVDQVKEKIGEYRDESRTDVGDLRKEVAELKKEVSKLKSSSSERTIDENDLYNLEEEYQATESTPTFPPQLAFSAPAGIPAFNQRIVPPVLPPAAYASLYGQNLYTLYNQFAQLQQPAPGSATPLFDPARHPHFPAVFPPAEPVGPMYPEVSHFMPPPVVPSVVPTVIPPVVPPVIPPVIPPMVTQAPPPVASRPTVAPQNKELPRSIPVNVVITSSDPLPARTTAPQPVLSVTIPPQHIKSSPHNYQIQLPATTNSSLFSGNTVQMKAFGATSANTTVSWTPKVNSTFESPKTSSLFDTPKLDLSGLNASFTTSPNTSLNKSRTLSEKSNTSVDNYDPCPDFKPIIPLPAEVQVTTGEEDETCIFSARAQLYRFADKQWKERGRGEIKLLKHKVTGKVRVLMRREQVHKICANHIITPDMELQLMKNETRAYIWVANDFADETVVLEKFCIRFKTADIASDFREVFELARKDAKTSDSTNTSLAEQKSEGKSAGFGEKFKPAAGSWSCPACYLSNAAASAKCIACEIDNPTLPKTANTGIKVIGGFTFSGTPTFKPAKEIDGKEGTPEEKATKPNPFSALSFKTLPSSPFPNFFSVNTGAAPELPKTTESPTALDKSTKELNTSDLVEEFEPAVDFKPVVPLPALVDQKTGEEDESVAFEHRSKLLRFDSTTKEWKERGLGNIKLLVNKNNNQKVRLLMRREIVMKVCCNHSVTKDMKFQKMPNQDKAVTWCAKDFSEGELTTETFCLRFKTADVCKDFIQAIELAQSKLSSEVAKEQTVSVKPATGFGDKFKPKPGSWSCSACYTVNVETSSKCIACEQPKVSIGEKKDSPESNSTLPLSVANWGDKFKPKVGSWECTQCLIRNDAQLEYCSACEMPKDPSKPKKEPKSLFAGAATTKFTFGIPQAASEPNKVQPPAGVTFGVNIQSKPAVPFTFAPAANTLQKNEDTSRTTPFSKFDSGKSLSPFSTPVKEVSFAKESNTFDFVMKPKSPGKGKSPMKSPQSDRGDVSDDDACSDDEGHHIHFTPVIPLPDKVEVATGEEDETELYSHRAKLYRFAAGEWKERGVGNVKILKHKDNEKLRVLMRREQIHKICLNHALTPEISYTTKDERTWLFTANDFSEGELSLQQFCLRFMNKDIASEFKQAVDNARGTSIRQPTEDVSDDVVFVEEIVATPEEKLKAERLMLPENFFAYEHRSACPGCRGCEEHSDGAEATPPSPSVSYGTPARSSPSYSSPTGSVFTTPMTTNKTVDISVFRTPMCVSDDDRTLSDSNNTFGDKENTFTPKASNIAASGDSPTLPLVKNANQAFGNASNILYNKNGNKSTNKNTPLLATPILNASNSSDSENLKPIAKTVIGAIGEPKSTFGTIAEPKVEAKSIFGSLGDQKPASVFGTPTNQKEVKSVFGTVGDQKPSSIFGTPSEQKEAKSVFGSVGGQKPASIFGTPSEQKEAKSVFGTVGDQKPSSVFGTPPEQKEAKSVFGSKTATTPSTVFGAALNQKPEELSTGSTTEETPGSIFGIAANQKLEQKSLFGATMGQPANIFGSTTGQPANVFGSTTGQPANLFGSTVGQPASTFGSTMGQPSSIFGMASTQKPEGKSVFGSTTVQTPGSFFGTISNQKQEEKSLPGSTTEQKTDPKSVFGTQKAEPLFGFSTVQNQNINPVFGSQLAEQKPMFGSSVGKPISLFGVSKPANGTTEVPFDSSKPIFGAANTADTAPNLFSQLANVAAKANETIETNPAPFSTDGSLTFAALSSNGTGIPVTKSDDFQWEGAGQQLFGQKGASKDQTRPEDSVTERSDAGEGEAAEEEYDPHYEPIVPLPDKIEVTTGEEDEEKLFGERAKLYRYDEKAREWKERGVGEMKLLHHPGRDTYRLLLRREQVYKAVLNTLLFKDLELLPLKNSDRAWTWASVNYAESAQGEKETLACRFKTVDLSNSFRDRVVEAVRKLQAADAVAVREARERREVPAPLPVSVERLQSAPLAAPPADTAAPAPEPEAEQEAEADEYDGGAYYDEEYEDEEQVVLAEASGTVAVAAGAEVSRCEEAALQLLVEYDMYGLKLMVTDANTGEILADTILCRDTPFQVDGAVATWSGTDYMTGEAVEKTITFTFSHPDVADDFNDTLQRCRNDAG